LIILKVKKKRIIFCTLLSIFNIEISIIAHSGRTDSDGGHYNRSNGEYHYHNGGSKNWRSKSTNYFGWIVLGGGILFLFSRGAG
jgi:hypothetical protein